MACRGLLWVGTNVGVVLTIPLPRLEGIPIVSGHAATSFHALNGPVTVLSNLNTCCYPATAILNQNSEAYHELPSEQKAKEASNSAMKLNTMHYPSQPNDNTSFQISNMPVATSREASTSQEKCDVYGLYGDLLRANTFTESDDNIYESLPNSDSDFLLNANTLPEARSHTTSRRPKSLDLTSVPLREKMDSSSSSEDSSSTQSFISIPEMTSTSQFNSSSASSCPIDDSPLPMPKQTVNDAPKTVTVIMGGRGYQNIHKMNSVQRIQGDTNLNHAHILFWEMRA